MGVTTSHSAPYAAPSVSQKLAIIDSWAKSDNIDIFSPQLYTSGVETEPEFAITQCGSTLDTVRTCSNARLHRVGDTKRHRRLIRFTLILYSDNMHMSTS